MPPSEDHESMIKTVLKMRSGSGRISDITAMCG